MGQMCGGMANCRRSLAKKPTHILKEIHYDTGTCIVNRIALGGGIARRRALADIAPGGCPSARVVKRMCSQEKSK